MPDKSFTAEVAFVTPVVPIDPVFLDLMQHYCDIEEMAKATVSAGTYGHKTISRDTVLTTHPDIRCRLRIMSSEEREDTARTGEVVSDYVLYIPFSYLPAKLRDNKKATSFRVVNIRTLYGLPEDAGPFDIQSVKLMAGEHHHYQVRLRKVN